MGLERIYDRCDEDSGDEQRFKWVAVRSHTGKLVRRLTYANAGYTLKAFNRRIARRAPVAPPAESVLYLKSQGFKTESPSLVSPNGRCRVELREGSRGQHGDEMESVEYKVWGPGN